jgi:nucleotide-binding universal stress UspA family protein
MFKRMLRVVPTPATPSELGGNAMFKKILNANDGSEPAFKALALALAVAAQNNAELHMVCVEEVSYLPEFAEEVREEVGTAARRFHGVLQRARAMAEPQHVKLHTHVVAGHPVRDILKVAADLSVDLLVIGATGHSALYERMIGSRADRIVQLAQCPVLVVK